MPAHGLGVRGGHGSDTQTAEAGEKQGPQVNRQVWGWYNDSDTSFEGLEVQLFHDLPQISFQLHSVFALLPSWPWFHPVRPLVPLTNALVYLR